MACLGCKVRIGLEEELAEKTICESSVISEQGAARAGRITGSGLASIIGQNRFKSRSKYLTELARDNDNFTGNDATEWGSTYEADALAHYQVATGHTLIQPGLLGYPKWDGVIAGTPDAVTRCGIVVEIKCPYTRSIAKENSKQYLKVPDYYLPQLKTYMAIVGATQADFVQYRPAGYGLGGREAPGREMELSIVRVSDKKDVIKGVTNQVIDMDHFIKHDLCEAALAGQQVRQFKCNKNPFTYCTLATH